MEVQTQWRASGFGLIGLDYPAVFRVAEVVGIEIDDSVLRKLRQLEAWTLENMQQEMEAQPSPPARSN